MNSPAFLGPGLALPEGRLTGDQYARLAILISARTPRHEALLHATTRRTGIAGRRSVLATADEDMPFYTKPARAGDPPPSTAARMDIYTREAPPLALSAAKSLMTREGIAPADVTHVLTVSCTGFMAPGLEASLAEALGLPRRVKRHHLGFMGCYGAVSAMGAARDICLGEPLAGVLVVSVELCTLHFQQGMGRNEILPNALFGDGAGAFLVTGAGHRLYNGAALRLEEAHTHLLPDTVDLMSWAIGDTGFRMTLDATVPDVVARELPGLAGQWGWTGDAASATWAIHPGGPRILQEAARALALPEPATAASRAVLRNHGNMSSATVLFILRELFDREASPPVRLLAFGPGLTVEAASLGRA